jgi:uncharacterized phiE125 gp8 family phage protein
MTLTITHREAVAEARLPVAELAAQLRLPDGWETVPGQNTRLVSRLQAALELIEARAGSVLLERDLVLEGRAVGGRLVSLPCAPVTSVVSVTADGVSVDLSGAVIERDGNWTRLCLTRALVAGAALVVTVRAGPGDWAGVPGALAQAVLVKAEALESMAEDRAEGLIAQLIAPHRRLGLGRS